VRLSRRLKSDNSELSTSKADTDKALSKAQQQENKLRLQLQSSEEALSRAKAAMEQASKQQKDELRQMGEEMRRRLEGEVARGGAEKQQIMEVRLHVDIEPWNPGKTGTQKSQAYVVHLGVDRSPLARSKAAPVFTHCLERGWN
jgi:hypothetical protein